MLKWSLSHSMKLAIQHALIKNDLAIWKNLVEATESDGNVQGHIHDFTSCNVY